MNEARRRALLASYAAGEMTAIDVRRALDGATFGDVLRMLADEGLPLPRASVQGREDTLARAREWLFPKEAHG
jgi:hypothetical protein